MGWDELFPNIGDPAHVLRVVVRLGAATILGGLVGFEREYEHKAAGMRTHMLVALGAAAFTLGPIEASMTSADVSRVIQGITAGIGFLGAGTIFKLTDQREVRGLTSAAGIWITAAIGTVVGLGYIWPAVVCVILGWIILYVVGRLEYWAKQRAGRAGKGGKES